MTSIIKISILLKCLWWTVNGENLLIDDNMKTKAHTNFHFEETDAQ